MSQLAQINETLPERRSLYFFITALDGKTPHTSAGGGQPSITTNGGALTTTGVGLLNHLGGGLYTAEVDAPGETALVVGFYGLAPGTVDSNVTPTPSFNTIQFTVQDPYTNKSDFTVNECWSHGTRTLTSLGAGAVDEIWNYDESYIVGGIGLRLKTNLDDAVTSRSTFDPNVDQVIVAPTGLDLIPITEPTGRAANFRSVVVQTWMRFVNEVEQDATTQTIKKSDGSTSVSGTVAKVAGVQTQGRKT